MTKRVTILISGGGSNMVALVKAMVGDFPARPVRVIANRADAGGLAKAADLGVPTAVISHKDYPSREAFDSALTTLIEQDAPDIICLAGFMRILTPAFAAHWQGRMLNIHPSLLPKHKGLQTHQRALDAGDTMHGCSVHGVTAELDGGPILGQARLTIQPGETAAALAARVLPLEHRLYPAVLHRFALGDRTPVDITG